MSVDACASFTFERIFIIRSANQERLYASDGNKRDSLEIGPTINLLTARDANGQFLFDLWHIGDILDISKLQEFGALTIVTHNGSSHFGRNDISNKRLLRNALEYVRENFRNKAAHKEAVSKNLYREAEQVLLSTEYLLWILLYIMKE